MFTKTSSKLANRINIISRYFDGTDVTNSVLFKELPNLEAHGEIEVTSCRFDLLASQKEIYGDPMYGWVLQIYNGLTEDDLKLGMKIPYPSLDDVKELIMSLDEYNS